MNSSYELGGYEMIKRLKYGVLAAAMAATAVAAIPASVSEAAIPGGQWTKDSKGWWYDLGGGKWSQREYVDGYWIKGNGYWDETKARASWKHNDKGWWYGSNGWYAKNQWLKIDGKWYFFHSDGYMAAGEYVKGNWFNGNGAWDEKSSGKWLKGAGANAGKWWYRDGSWYPKNQWLKIDGYYYYFDAEGWMVSWTVKKIDGFVFGFGGSGRLGNITVFNFNDTVEGSITFTFDEFEDRYDAAEDMDMFLTLTMDPGTTKVCTVNGVQRTLSVKSVIDPETGDMEPAVYIDDETLIDYVAKSQSESVTVEGAGSLAKLLEAFDADLLVGGRDYNFTMTIGDLEGKMEITKFAMSDGYVTATIDGKNYQALYDGTENGQPRLFFLSKLSSSLGQKLADNGLLSQEGEYNCVEINTVDYTGTQYQLVPED